MKYRFFNLPEVPETATFSDGGGHRIPSGIFFACYPARVYRSGHGATGENGRPANMAKERG